MTELPLGADGYLDMDSVPDTDVDEAGTADLFVEPDPVPDAVWSRMLSTAVTDTDSDVDDLVPPPGAATWSGDPSSDDPSPGETGADDAGYSDDGPADADSHVAHDWSDGDPDPGADGGHDGVHEAGWHDGGW